MARRRKKRGIVAKVFFTLGLLISIGVGMTAGAIVHKGDSMISLMNYDQNNALSSVDLSQYQLDKDTEIVNILLVGADKNLDEQDADVDRRSDSMMIATLDVKHKKLKVTSLMRDLYVEVPGRGKNKLNAAYSLGGIKLLYKTVAQNFGIKMDGYAEVNFDAFVNVIDELGGVEVSLSESEAKHLNLTNYIKRRKNRHMKKGPQLLNGYQALGYCRIRHGKTVNGITPAVYTTTGKCDDYGRTERQRNVIQAIFKKIKSLSIDDLMKIAETVLPNITTDLSEDQIYSYMMAVVQMGTTKINQFRVPVDGTFTSQRTNAGSSLVPDLAANKKALKKFIFQ